MIADCPGCGRVEARRWWRVGPWRVVKCCRCGLGITWPRPDPVQLERFYADGYYDERGMGESAAQPWLARAAALIGLLPSRPASVLDVGAGQGHFVAGLRELGIPAEGIEPLLDGRRAAYRIHGLALREDWPSSRYDAVALIHSLEHVPDPLSTLRECERRLAREGHLLIEVPHAGSVELLRPRRRRFILSLPGHLHHFTPSNLELLLGKVGLVPSSVHLRNPDALEWLLALRARRKPPAGETISAGGVARAGPAGSHGAAGRGLAARLWRESLLPRLRRRFPGWSFAMVARRASPGQFS
jgi:SAM-dependent methyltransferase